jgi:hypothetical protein
MSTVQVNITGGPSVSVPWLPNMNAQQALEGAYNQLNNSSQFTYATQYYGTSLGYLVVMVNETYDSFISSSAPFFYWEFIVNGTPAQTGIDGVVLNPGDNVTFSLDMYVAEKHQASTLCAKYSFQTQAIQRNA